MEPLHPEELTDKAVQAVTTQSYDAAAGIDGVKLMDLQSFIGDDGYFFELMRFQAGMTELFPEFEVKQLSYSQVLPGAIKAFHLHYNQDDIWFVPPHERLLVVLHDVRQNSATVGVTKRIVLGGGKAKCVFIPRGVAHGGANLWPDSSSIIYLVNQTFDKENPDEHRLPWDFVGADVWQMSRG